MKESKRFLSLILCLAMAITVVPAFTVEAAAESTSYIVTLTKGIGGQVSVSGTKSANFAASVDAQAQTVTAAALTGNSITITATPFEGYAVEAISACQTDSKATIEITKNKFTMPEADVTIAVTFKKISGDTSWYSDSSKQFTLKDADDLQGFIYLVNGKGNTFQGKTVIMGYDNPVVNESIGNADNKYFQGTFDGNGKVITLNITDTNSDYAGLFGNAHSANIINVGVTGSVTGAAYVGGIVGYAQNSGITNCYSHVSVTSAENKGTIVGRNDSSTFTNCYSKEANTCGYGSIGSDTYAPGLNGMTAANMTAASGDEALVTILNSNTIEYTGQNDSTKKAKTKAGVTLKQWTNTVGNYPVFSATALATVKHEINVYAKTNCKSASAKVSKAYSGDTVQISVTANNGYYFNYIIVYKTSDYTVYTKYTDTSFKMPDYEVDVDVYCGEYQLSKSTLSSQLSSYDTTTTNRLSKLYSLMNSQTYNTTNLNNGKSLSDYLYGGSTTSTKTSSSSSSSSSTSTARTTAITKKMNSVTKYTVPAKYVDVTAKDYFAQPVAWATAKKIADGVDSTHFGPDVPTSRAEMITFIWKAEGSPEPRAKISGFYDVATSAAYNKAVIWAIENGITDGTSGTTFSPDATVTRAQAVTFLARLNGVTSSTKYSSHSFTDVPKDSYYNNAVAWAYDNYITEGTSAVRFSPDVTCTRGEIITFVYRAYNFL